MNISVKDFYEAARRSEACEDYVRRVFDAADPTGVFNRKFVHAFVTHDNELHVLVGSTRQDSIRVMRIGPTWAAIRRADYNTLTNGEYADFIVSDIEDFITEYAALWVRPAVASTVCKLADAKSIVSFMDTVNQYNAANQLQS